MKKDVPSQALRMAEARAGVLTRPELRDHAPHSKVLRRWVRGWTTLVPGYYCVGEPSWESWCWAGLLRAGPSGVVSGAAAGYLHGFVAKAPSRITIFHQGRFQLSPMMGAGLEVVFRRGQRDSRGALGRTSVETALVDLARDATEDEVVMAIARALAEKLTTRDRVAHALGQRERVRHRRTMEQLCDAAAEGVESVLEWRFLEMVLKAHGLPLPTRQAKVLDGARADNLWEEFGVLVELDGHLGHEDRFRDMNRDNRAAMKGYTTLRYGWRDVLERPCEVAAEILAVLRDRGWRRGAAKCRCRAG